MSVNEECLVCIMEVFDLVVGRARAITSARNVRGKKLPSSAASNNRSARNSPTLCLEVLPYVSYRRITVRLKTKKNTFAQFCHFNSIN